MSDDFDRKDFKNQAGQGEPLDLDAIDKPAKTVETDDMGELINAVMDAVDRGEDPGMPPPPPDLPDPDDLVPERSYHASPDFDDDIPDFPEDPDEDLGDDQDAFPGPEDEFDLMLDTDPHDDPRAAEDPVVEDDIDPEPETPSIDELLAEAQEKSAEERAAPAEIPPPSVTSPADPGSASETEPQAHEPGSGEPDIDPLADVAGAEQIVLASPETETSADEENEIDNTPDPEDEIVDADQNEAEDEPGDEDEDDTGGGSVNNLIRYAVFAVAAVAALTGTYFMVDFLFPGKPTATVTAAPAGAPAQLAQRSSSQGVATSSPATADSPATVAKTVTATHPVEPNAGGDAFFLPDGSENGPETVSGPDTGGNISTQPGNETASNETAGSETAGSDNPETETAGPGNAEIALQRSLIAELRNAVEQARSAAESSAAESRAMRKQIRKMEKQIARLRARLRAATKPNKPKAKSASRRSGNGKPKIAVTAVTPGRAAIVIGKRTRVVTVGDRIPGAGVVRKITLSGCVYTDKSLLKTASARCM